MAAAKQRKKDFRVARNKSYSYLLMNSIKCKSVSQSPVISASFSAFLDWYPAANPTVRYHRREKAETSSQVERSHFSEP